MSDRPSTAEAASARLTAKVPFLFGVAERSRLPGTLLVRLLGDIGVSTSAARSVLARMRREGSLTSIPRGRSSDYELAGLVADAFWRIRDSANPDLKPRTAPPRAWPGELHGFLYEIPDSQRANRDRFRRSTMLAGYARLRPGLVVSPWDRSKHLAEMIASLPSSCSVTPVRLVMSPEGARTAAAQAWELPAVAHNINWLADQLERGLATAPPKAPGPAALHCHVDTALPAYMHLVAIPQLPPELLPPDWPMPRLVEAMGTVRNHLGVPAGQYVRGLLPD